MTISDPNQTAPSACVAAMSLQSNRLNDIDIHLDNASRKRIAIYKKKHILFIIPKILTAIFRDQMKKPYYCITAKITLLRQTPKKKGKKKRRTRNTDDAQQQQKFIRREYAYIYHIYIYIFNKKKINKIKS